MTEGSEQIESRSVARDSCAEQSMKTVDGACHLSSVPWRGGAQDREYSPTSISVGIALLFAGACMSCMYEVGQESDLRCADCQMVAWKQPQAAV